MNCYAHNVGRKMRTVVKCVCSCFGVVNNPKKIVCCLTDINCLVAFLEVVQLLCSEVEQFRAIKLLLQLQNSSNRDPLGQVSGCPSVVGGLMVF